MSKVDSTDPNVLRETVKNPVRNVAVVGILNKKDKILLVRTKRFPDHWQPIGGGMKKGDKSPIDTLQRELKEETNLKLKLSDFKHILTTNYDFGEGNVYFYVVKLPDNTEMQFDTNELIDWQWFTLRDAILLKMFPATEKFINKLLSEMSIS